MQRTLSMLAGFISGLIVGAVSALLFAPEPGMELRVHTREWLNNALEEARLAAAEKRVELNDQFDALKRGETPPPPEPR